MNSNTKAKIEDVELVLLDLGGVLLNIDYKRTEKAFQDLGFSDFETIYSQARQSGLFDEFECGRLSSDEFVGQLLTLMNHEHSVSDVIHAWNAMLLDFPGNRIDVINRLKERFKVYLLSNTNEIHYEAFMSLFSAEFDKNFSDLFDKAFYSHQIGMRKPNAEVFEHILREAGVSPSKVLFIDDSIQHVEGASKVGIQSFLLNDQMDVGMLLSRLGILA